MLSYCDKTGFSLLSRGIRNLMLNFVLNFIGIYLTLALDRNHLNNLNMNF